MPLTLSAPRRRLLIPEVVQTSAMDCGPATLKALLEGFGIPVSYGRLREACQTDIDGTSIDTIEEIALQLGLDAEQVMVPVDHVLLSESQTLPAIIVVTLPNGLTHFVVVWSCHGQFVQIMDPATGRRWLSKKRFMDEVYVHKFPVPAMAWLEWAGSEGFCDPLRQRMVALGMDDSSITGLIDLAINDPVWHTLAALDAATRLVTSMVLAKAIQTGTEAARILESFFNRAAQKAPEEAEAIIPKAYWSVHPQPPDPDAPDEELVLLQGAVLVRVLGRAAMVEAEVPGPGVPAPEPTLSPTLAAALKEPPSRPEWELLRALQADGLLTPVTLVFALAMAAGAVIIEALLLRGLLDIGQSLGLVSQRAGALGMLFVFILGLLLLELPISATVSRMGRKLETRLRIAFLDKLPRLGDRYFHSRLTSDMTQRAYDLRQLRILPTLGATILRLSFQIILTATAVIWLDPRSAPIAIIATIAAVGFSFVTQPLLSERDMRLRTHTGALSRFYLDALLGLIPVRAHSAERAVRREHESLLVEWARAGQAFYDAGSLIQTVEALVGSFFAIWIMFNYVSHGGEISGLLLLLYWSLNLPLLGQALAEMLQQYPIMHNRLLRLLEPLGAPDETASLDSDISYRKSYLEELSAVEAAGIHMRDVFVQASGHTILANINLEIQPGEHIAIIGPSGAGKSSLVGLLLGWHKPARGEVRVNARILAGPYLQALRRVTAWVDPEVQIWNQSLLNNLRYGSQNAQGLPLSALIEQADLMSVLEKLPQGLQTSLGEGGGLVSGGEGQRVRLGRAMLRDSVKLVILDEPFRGLGRGQRRDLLSKAREYWKTQTLICVTHDIQETENFSRVLVIEEGQLVEDGSPVDLAKQPDSRYYALVEASVAVKQKLWGHPVWRKLWLEEGKIEENIP